MADNTSPRAAVLLHLPHNQAMNFGVLMFASVSGRRISALCPPGTVSVSYTHLRAHETGAYL
eukprot:4425883-Pyramimonas_sp.AAC.1